MAAVGERDARIHGMAMEVLSAPGRVSFEYDGARGERPVGASRPALDRQVALETPAEHMMTVGAGRWTTLELRVVRAAAATARPLALRRLAVSLSILGNGWIYILIAAIVLAKWRMLGMRIIVPAGVNALLLHSVYPMIKRVFGRPRPFETDPKLPSLLKILDAYSFPSGHAMTLAGVLTPVVMLWPGSALPATLVGLGVAWSRVATAHHYPSDVLAGAALGIGVGYPTTAFLVSVIG